VVWLLEIAFPWRKNQAIFRKDFWLDLFYMFFNFFLLNLIFLIALSNVTEQLLNDFLAIFGFQLASIQLFSLSALPKPFGLVLFFILGDFVPWNTHRLLHRIPFLCASAQNASFTQTDGICNTISLQLDGSDYL